MGKDRYEKPISEKNAKQWHHSEKGDVFYDTTAWDAHTHGYARLLTQNWWYGVLLWTLLNTTLAIMDIYSNFVYVGNLFNEDGNQLQYSMNTDYRYNFLVSFLCLEVFIIGQAWRSSHRELKKQMK